MKLNQKKSGWGFGFAACLTAGILLTACGGQTPKASQSQDLFIPSSPTGGGNDVQLVIFAENDGLTTVIRRCAAGQAATRNCSTAFADLRVSTNDFVEKLRKVSGLEVYAPGPETIVKLNETLNNVQMSSDERSCIERHKFLMPFFNITVAALGDQRDSTLGLDMGTPRVGFFQVYNQIMAESARPPSEMLTIASVDASRFQRGICTSIPLSRPVFQGSPVLRVGVAESLSSTFSCNHRVLSVNSEAGFMKGFTLELTQDSNCVGEVRKFTCGMSGDNMRCVWSDPSRRLGAIILVDDSSNYTLIREDGRKGDYRVR